MPRGVSISKALPCGSAFFLVAHARLMMGFVY